jgi:hypothetical protein
MATTIFAGFFDDLLAGDAGGAPDLRCHLVMSGFSGQSEEDAVHVADLTALDEFDGLGYTALDCADVSVAYDAAADEVRVTFDSGAGDEFGDPVAPGSDVIAGMVVLRHVDGTPANDVLWVYTSDGGFGVNAANGPVGLSLPAAGLLLVRPAA